MSEKDKIKQVLVDYVTAGLVEQNVEKVLSYIDDGVMGIGMGEQGFVANKAEVKKVMSTGIKANTNARHELEIEMLEVQMVCDTVATMCARIIVICDIEGVITRSGLMQSLTVKLTNGQWRIVALHASPIMLSEECIEAYPLQFAENTLAHLKQELQSEAFTLINHSIPGGILSIRVCESGYPLYFVNDSMLSYLGYTYDEFIAQYEYNIMEMIHPDERTKAVHMFKKILKCGQDEESRFRVQKKNGDVLWMVARGRKSTDDNGKEILLLIFMDVTEMVLLQEELEERTKALSISEERFRIALEKTTNIIFDYDLISGNIMHSSAPKKSPDFVTNIDNALNTLIIGGTVMPESVDTFSKAFMDIQNGKSQSECIVKVRMASGKQIWNKISMTAVADESGRSVRAIGMIEDITKQKEAELAYAREEQYRQAILADALAYYVINFSRDICESCEIMDPHCVRVEPGTSYSNVISESSKARMTDEHRMAFLDKFSIASVMAAFEQGESEIKLEYHMFNPDGTDTWMQTILRLVQDVTTNEKKGFLYVTDIDERKRVELLLTRKAQRDPLTGVYNKSVAEDKIRELLKSSEATQTGVFMMIDVDNFKSINDQYGHPFGDKVLVDAANGIISKLRDSDVVGRLGGDEFGVFFYGMCNLSSVKDMANEICRVFHNLYTAPEGRTNPSCSIGISVCAGKVKTFEQLYKEADEALYQAKKAGRNRYEIYQWLKS